MVLFKQRYKWRYGDITKWIGDAAQSNVKKKKKTEQIG